MTEEETDTEPEIDEAPEGLFDDLEVQVHRAVLRREQTSGSFPDSDAVAAMEEPFHRLTGATVLFADLAIASFNGPPSSTMGLDLLAGAMNREALRLFRVYHGHPPRYEQYWAGDGSRQ